MPKWINKAVLLKIVLLFITIPFWSKLLTILFLLLLLLKLMRTDQ